MKIGNYLKLKEDFNLMKNLLFQSKDGDIFKEFYDFPVILNSLNNKIANNSKGFYVFLRDSFDIEEKKKEFSSFRTEDFFNKFCYLERKFKDNLN